MTPEREILFRTGHLTMLDATDDELIEMVGWASLLSPLVCELCGALVSDTALHTRWHGALRRGGSLW